jgi:hypothetical protein
MRITWPILFACCVACPQTTPVALGSVAGRELITNRCDICHFKGPSLQSAAVGGDDCFGMTLYQAKVRAVHPYDLGVSDEALSEVYVELARCRTRGLR